MEPDAATKCIIDGTTDLAFTSGKTAEDRLLQIPVFLGKMVLVVGARLPFGTEATAEELKKAKRSTLNGTIPTMPGISKISKTITPDHHLYYAAAGAIYVPKRLLGHRAGQHRQ